MADDLKWSLLFERFQTKLLTISSAEPLQLFLPDFTLVIERTVPSASLLDSQKRRLLPRRGGTRLDFVETSFSVKD